MKLLVVSDLHLEHAPYPEELLRTLSDAYPDGIIISGDICSYPNLEHYLELICDQFEFVMFVSGITDHWYSSVKQVLDLRDKMINRYAHLYWLYRDIVTLGRQRFLGCTLWYNYSTAKPLDRGSEQKLIQDLVNDSQREHQADTQFIKNNMSPGDVVVTYFAPSSLVLGERTKRMGALYSVDQEDPILENPPRFWLYGRTHEPQLMSLYGSTLLSNPLGYEGEIKGDVLAIRVLNVPDDGLCELI